MKPIQRRDALIWFAPILLVGCSSASSQVESGTPDSGAVQPAEAGAEVPNDGGATLHDGAVSPLDGGAFHHDGSSAPDGMPTSTDASAEGSTGAPLWPFAVGATWSYATSGVITGPCGAVLQRTVLSTGVVDGRTAFDVSGCSIDEEYATGPGDEVDVDVGGTWLRLIDPPLEVGHSWSYGGYATYTWQRPASVTVPAGTYSDCWIAASSDPTYATNTYCRGVGPVQVDTASSGQLLTATSF